MRPWFKLVAASNTWHPDSTWDNSRSIPIPRGPAEEGLCCPGHVPGKLWGSLFLLAYSPLGEESKPETDPGGDTRRGRCSLLRTRKQPDGDRRGWPERPCKLTLLKAAATSVKWGTPKVLRLSRWQDEVLGRMSGRGSPKDRSHPAPSDPGVSHHSGSSNSEKPRGVLLFCPGHGHLTLIPAAWSGQGAGLGTPEGEAYQDHW